MRYASLVNLSSGFRVIFSDFDKRVSITTAMSLCFADEAQVPCGPVACGLTVSSGGACMYCAEYFHNSLFFR